MNPEIWLAEAEHLIQEGTWLAALSVVEAGLEETPDCVDGWECKGYILQEGLKRYEEALTAHDQALSIKRDDCGAWNHRGLALYNLHRYEDAIIAFDQSLTIQPNNHKAWFNRYLALYYLGRYEEAVASHDQALKIDPDMDLYWNYRGFALYNLGRYVESIAAYDQALKIKSDDYEAWFYRGITLYSLERYKEAIESYDEALKANPDDYYAWLNRGGALRNLDRNEEAIESYDQALKIKPDDYSSWSSRGSALSSLKRYEEAIESYDQALKIKPDDYEAWFCRGITLYSLERYKEAIESYDEALKANPDDYYAWLSRGSALRNLDRNEEAIESYDRALEIKYDYNAWFYKGNALKHLERYEEAIESYDQALKIKPDDYSSWSSRGSALSSLKRYEEAIESYGQAIKVKPDDYYAWSNRGATLYILERYEEAIESYDRALEIKSKSDHNAWLCKGNALKHLERYEEAIESYDQALKIKPDDHISWSSRGSALSSLDRYIEAIESHDQALKIKSDYYEAWYNRASTICHFNTAQLSMTHLQNVIWRQSIVALRHPEPHIAALREAFSRLTKGSVAWAQVYLALGNTYFTHSVSKANVLSSWRKALRSYEIALPILSTEAFSESHLQVLQGLIRAHLLLQNFEDARMYQDRGRPVFEKLRSTQPDHLKSTFESKFSSFSKLEIDLLVSENNAIAAIERAEFYKNRCLTWILDGCKETIISPRYFEIQSLCKRDTAILYWHLSIDNLTTFIVTANSNTPVVLESDRYQQAQELEKWIKSWDVYYRDYAEKKIPATSDRLNHPWRKELNSKLTGLYHILQADTICKQLEQSPSKIKKLILIPHRDLHRFPIHTCFPEFSYAYLPSAQIGLNLQNRSQKGSSYSPLLSVEDPKTDQPKMPFAQLESAIVRCLVEPTTIPIKRAEATIEKVSHALEESHTTFHFTGHGAYNSLRPETSALSLSDGFLTVRDVSKLNLSSYRLVCLAACETALTGKDSVTKNEYIGLASAFLQAGASNVLSTLWPVDEIASCWFTIYFYQNLISGKSPAIALHEAQQWLQSVTLTELSGWITQLSNLPGLEPGIVDRLEARAKNILNEGSIIGSANAIPYSHPFYWGAFTLTGQG